MRRIRNRGDGTVDPYVSVSEAARALGISRPTVHARVAAGKLDQEMVAGRPVITRESLSRLLAEMAPESKAA